MMRTNLWSVLSSALLLSACGQKEVGTDLPPCKAGELSDFDLPHALSGLELRASDAAVEGPARVLRALGDSCSSTTCAAAVEEVDARRAGWLVHSPQQGPQIEYVIGMHEGDLLGSATSDAELLQLIGPIDTLAEAELVAELKSMNCVRAGEKDGSFQVVDRQLISDCLPLTTQDVLFRVDPDASVHELDRADEVSQSACVGRRPAGLAPRKRLAQSSAVGDFLARSAELEAASVVAFRVLEAELRAHGAPRILLDRTCEAAADEVLHARVMRRWAERELDGAARERIAKRRAEAVRELGRAVAQESEPAAVRDVLGLPDAAAGQRLFTHMKHALWS